MLGDAERHQIHTLTLVGTSAKDEPGREWGANIWREFDEFRIGRWCRGKECSVSVDRVRGSLGWSDRGIMHNHPEGPVTPSVVDYQVGYRNLDTYVCISGYERDRPIMQCRVMVKPVYAEEAKKILGDVNFRYSNAQDRFYKALTSSSVPFDVVEELEKTLEAVGNEVKRRYEKIYSQECFYRLEE